VVLERGECLDGVGRGLIEIQSGFHGQFSLGCGQ
jgi:hypothetical protein